MISYKNFKTLCKSEVEGIISYDSTRIIQNYNLAEVYPNTIVFFKTPTHFGFELLGVSKSPESLNSKERKIEALSDVFSLFPKRTKRASAMSVVDGFSIAGMKISEEEVEKKWVNKTPIMEKYERDMIFTSNMEAVVDVSRVATHCSFSRFLIAQHHLGLNRCKHIFFMAIFSRKVKSLEQLKSWVEEVSRHPATRGDFLARTQYLPAFFQGVPPDDVSLELVSQIQNISKSPGMHETSIADFIIKNGSALERYFSSQNFLYEKSLDWIEHDGTVEESSIRPDLFVQREDGFYDIVDFKLARMDKGKLTVGQRNRRKFSAYVSDEIHQLANYEWYFSFPKNAKFAYEKYGIKIKAPMLYLIVGNSENIIHQEVTEALRAHPAGKFVVVDYDSLAVSLLEDLT